MKIALKCSNVLLERTLRLFLQEHLASIKESDFIICDEDLSLHKPCFKISENGHLSLPFSSTQLHEALEEFLSTISQENPRNCSLEERLDEILERFKKDIIGLINEAKLQ